MWRNQPGVMLSYILAIGWTMVSSQITSKAISGPLASKEGADILGDSVCNFSPNDIETFGKNLLMQLSQCPSITPDQASAIRAVVRNGDTSFGSPSEWTSSTLDKLRGLFHLFDHNILEQIPKSVLLPWMKDFSGTSLPPRAQLSAVDENLSVYRRKRATGCPPDKTVTEEVVKDVTMPLDYSPEELRACLKGPILADNLGLLTNYAFTEEQQPVIKNNLDEMFPNGYPESILQNLGSFVNVVNQDDVKKWKFTSSGTLASLMGNMTDDKLAPAVLKQYLDSGGPLNGEALNAIGSKDMCLLNENQLNQISEALIKEIKSPNLSRCNQSAKNILYSKAKKAFSDQENNFPDYYNKIQPYLGGAPVEGLRFLSNHNVNMDIKTFMGLRNDSLMGLTTNEVKGLLGTNLEDLKKERDNFPVKDWIREQKQSDLYKIGIKRGGIPEGYINIMPRN